MEKLTTMTYLKFIQHFNHPRDWLLYVFVSGFNSE